MSDKLDEFKQVLKNKKEVEEFLKQQQQGEDSQVSPQVEVKESKEGTPPLASESHSQTSANVQTSSSVEWEEKLKKAENLAKENQDKFLRLYAEFENYKKRVSREKEEMKAYVQEQVLKELLPFYDDFERSVLHAQSATELKTIVEGLQMIEKQFVSTLEKQGLKVFSALGKSFDPHYHEAMTQIEMPGQASNTVVQEFRKGFTFHEKLLRAALVAVSK